MTMMMKLMMMIVIYQQPISQLYIPDNPGEPVAESMWQ